MNNVIIPAARNEIPHQRRRSLTERTTIIVTRDIRSSGSNGLIDITERVARKTWMGLGIGALDT